MQPFSVVLLAAGSSSRLGRPKQLVPIGGAPLIQRAVDTARAAGPSELIVVLGAFSDEIRAALGSMRPRGGLEPKVVVNRDWQTGMSSSIRAGVQKVDPASAALVLMLCDQLRVTPELLSLLAGAVSGDTQISATRYDGRVGAPCAFGRSVFPDLLKLEGDRGARDLIRDPNRRVTILDFEEAAFDLDTEQDLAEARRVLEAG